MICKWLHSVYISILHCIEIPCFENPSENPCSPWVSVIALTIMLMLLSCGCKVTYLHCQSKSYHILLTMQHGETCTDVSSPCADDCLLILWMMFHEMKDAFWLTVFYCIVSPLTRRSPKYFTDLCDLSQIPPLFLSWQALQSETATAAES